MNLEISKPLNTHKKRHILPPLKPHNFCIKQFFIRRIFKFKSYFRYASYVNHPV